MVKYEINEHIPACHINKDFLTKLEDYIKSKIPNLIGISKKILSEKYSITISDEKGKEEIKSISDYTSNLFPDSIEDNRLPRLYRRGTHLNRLLSVPVYREFALIPTLTDGEFPLN